ncbi:MAG: SDR family oxidoreductase [Candidatus Dormibacteraeota bacterium]|nr:SDR family oxidoreductase [Candidatus Dormibacteraeota bacterium]
MSVLTGKVAMVTGAAGGIGGAVVAAFVAEGARVFAVDRDVSAVPRSPSVEPFACDVTDAARVEDAVAQCRRHFGGLQMAFNGAGISGRRLGDGPVDACTDEGWRAVIDTNLTGVFHCCRAQVRAMLEDGAGGTIVNLASVLGLVGGDEDFATHAYAASKGGVIALSRAIAVTYARRGISCNVIAAGLIATPMSQRAQADPKIRARLPELQPLTGDFGRPEDVAAAAMYLCGPGARFTTGAVLTLDGGWTAR